MNRLVVGVMVAAVCGSAPLAAQFQQPQCELSTGHFLVQGAVVYLKNAAEEPDTQKSERMLADARRNLLDALSRGEEENPAVWYFLGRSYEAAGDARGADSTWTRAQELEPECAEDIAYHRQIMWVPRVNRAIDRLRTGDFEGAREVLYEANAIWRQDPIAFYYLARIYGNEGEVDSALTYFRIVLEIGVTDSARAEPVKDAFFSMGRLYSMLGQREDRREFWDSAATWYGRYREQWPEDVEVISDLAQAYDESGNRDKALALYDSVLARAEGMEPQMLFQVGTKLFLAEKFAPAAQAFEAGLAKNPYSRDALFNLANSYLAMSDDDQVPRAARTEAPRKMLDVTRRLLRLDPLNQESLRLLAAAHQLVRNNDSTLLVFQRLEAMRWHVYVDFFEPMSGGWGISGRIANATKAAVQVPELIFEFLDVQGNVVASHTVPAQRVGPESAQGFEVTVEGREIAGWRYRAGS